MKKEKMSWLKLFFNELSEITPQSLSLVEPSEEISANDHKVGEMSDDLKKIYGLWKNTVKLGIQYIKDVRQSSESISGEVIRNNQRLEKKVEMLYNMFWFSVREEFNLWDKFSIGIRKGFIVVWTEEECEMCKLIDKLQESMVQSPSIIILS